MPRKTIGLLIGGLTAIAALSFIALTVLPTTPTAAQSAEPITITNEALYQRLRGYIILRVQSKGQAYYVHPHKMEMYYLGRPSDMFRIMREQGVGITNKDLAKIRDGGIANNTAPYDLSFSKKQAGRIFLQVESKGEAWYVSPRDFKRYYLGRPKEAFDIVRQHAIGISEKDFQALTYREEQEKPSDMPVACTQQYDPVCGVDGKTYPNQCVAVEQNKVQVKHKGACEKSQPSINQPPVANAGADQTITDTDGDGKESVTLDGSGSKDPDGKIAFYSWVETFHGQKRKDEPLATGVKPTVALKVGGHTIVLTVTDNKGAQAQDTVIITVNSGTTPPPPTSPPPPPQGQGQLLFKSGFESGVALNPPSIDSTNSKITHYLVGGDKGFAWDVDLPTATGVENGKPYKSKAHFQDSALNMVDSITRSDYVDRRIEPVTGYTGKSTQSLYLEVKQWVPNVPSTTYNSYRIPVNNLKQAYVRYYMKLQPDIKQVLKNSTNLWRIIYEWKEYPPDNMMGVGYYGVSFFDYRVSLAVGYAKDTDALYWYAEGNEVASPNVKTWTVKWRYNNQKVQVPENKWFLVEVFYKLDKSNGRFWAAIDGQKIIDHNGETQFDDYNLQWWPFNLYTDRTAVPAYQWIDDFELWSDFPGTGGTPPKPTPEICTDGKDNDGDGLIDAADPDCQVPLPPTSGARDPALWPFTATSPWNHPIGANAQYTDITSPTLKTSGSGLANINCKIFSKPIFIAQPTDPLRQIYRTGDPTPLFTIRAPSTATPDPGSDATLFLIDENHRFFVEMWKAVKRADGDFEAQGVYQNDTQDAGVYPFRHGVSASGVSSLGGTIRKGELTNGIKHALHVSVKRTAMNQNGPNGVPYVWPAVSADRAWQTSYASTGNVFMGSLLAIPQNVDITQIGVWTSGPAYEIAKAMQTYGVYVLDAVGGNANMAFKLEPTACSELAGLEALGKDWSSIVIPLLKVVTNNSPTNIGGGGTPVAPLAPAFDPQYGGVS